MRKLLAGLLAFSVVSSLVIFPSCEQHRRRHKHIKKHVKVFHLNDGRACYKDPNTDVWFWLTMADVDGGNPTYYTSNSAINAATKFPAGVHWSQMKENEKIIEPDEKELQEVEESFEGEVVTDEVGNPEVDADGNLVDPDTMSPDEGYGPDTTDSSDSVGDSGSDSGGGDAGGGDGGGGGDGD